MQRNVGNNIGKICPEKRQHDHKIDRPYNQRCQDRKPCVQGSFRSSWQRRLQKGQLTHDSTTARQSSIGLLVSIGAIMEFDFWTEYISQAYLQSASKLLREVHLKRNRQLKEPAGYELKLICPLYGLANSGGF